MTKSLKKYNLIIRSIVVVILMLSTYAYVTLGSYCGDVPPRQSFSAFPKRIDTWIGKEHVFSDRVYDILGVDDSTLIRYSNENAEDVELYIGYYRSQRKGDLIHSPKHCMPGSGWRIAHVSSRPIVTGNKGTVNVVQLDIQKGAEKRIVLYWFHSRGRLINSEYMQKIYLVWDAITRNRTDGSFVRIIAPVGSKGADYTIDYLNSFVTELLPVLDEYIPT